VPGLPIVSGDVISTADEPAIVKLADGSTFMLDKNSSVKVQQCGATSVEVLTGTTTYRFAPASKAQLCALGHPATAAAMTQGSISIEPPDQAVMRTVDKATVSLPSGQCLCSTASANQPNHHRTILIVVVAGAAAAALALGLALTLPGSVSPSTPTT
jgi:ferric-dicitrate binding protein FerR (iron transport regulator)